MPIYQLTEEIIFPHPSLAEPDGLLAIGGDLSPIRILTAYANGIFPWFSDKDPILWWSPNPRCISLPSKFKPSKSLKQFIKKATFKVKFDTDFKSVIRNCAKVKRNDADGTWITEEVENAYFELHRLGYAHSVETYLNDLLVGGLYGVAIGKVFLGESMFFTHSNASKIAFYTLIEFLKKYNFEIIDNQMTTPHLLSLGAEEISREKFIEILGVATRKQGIIGSWNGLLK